MNESLSDKFEALVSPGTSGSDVRATNTPEAWRPRMDVGEDGGYVVSTPRTAGEIPDAAEILSEFGLNADSWNVISIRESRWQKFDGEWLQAFRVNLKPAETYSRSSDFDLEQLVDEIKKWKPGKIEKVTSGELAYLVAPSDQQIGKKANGQGTPQSVQRILQTTDGSVQRLKDLRKIGKSIGTVVLALPGDHVEGNTSQNGRLQGLASSDLGLTEQTRVARRLLMAQIKAFAPLCDRLIVPVVNGNHDEVTRQVVADPSDGWNVEIASAVHDACAENPELKHVEFRYPAKDHQTLAVEICGTMLGLFHGHQSGRDVLKYLSGQAAGQTALGMCDLWVSGHFHSFKSMDIGSRFWVQAPTTDPGSAWFRDRQGLESNAGLLTMVIGEGYDPRQDLSIIPATR
jgi:hypothetical protein